MSPFYRQNDREAITYLKASYRCLRKERDVKYALIVISFFVCLCGIFNKYLPMIFRGFEDIAAVQTQASIYINLASGVVIISTLIFSFYTYRMHLEGICLQERFDCYTFETPLNQAITRPISQTVIELYASKVKRKNDKFRNMYYDDLDEVDEKTGHFDNINRQLHSDYRLYLSVQPFFLTMWIGFCIIIVLIAISLDDKFVNTLVNILFPSMSAITTIGNSWFTFRQQIKQLQTALVVVDGIQALPDRERMQKMTDPLTLRMLQTSLFNFRMSAFVIPNFLIRHHEKILARESWGLGERKSSDLIVAMADKRTAELRGKKALKRLPEQPAEPFDDIPTLYLPDIKAEAMPAIPPPKKRTKTVPPDGAAAGLKTDYQRSAKGSASATKRIDKDKKQ